MFDSYRDLFLTLNYFSFRNRMLPKKKKDRILFTHSVKNIHKNSDFFENDPKLATLLSQPLLNLDKNIGKFWLKIFLNSVGYFSKFRV